MLSILAGAQGLGSLVIDLNKTHATNPRWPGHARFHVVWQSWSSFVAAVPAVALVWWGGPQDRWRFYLAAVFTSVPMVGFIVAALLRGWFGATFHDANGILPWRFRLSGREFSCDGNAVMIDVGLTVLAVAVLLFHYAT